MNIVAMVPRGAFLQVAVGLLIGLPLAIMAGHFMASKVFLVRSYDPYLLGTSIIALGLCAAIASILPARLDLADQGTTYRVRKGSQSLSYLRWRDDR